MSYRNSYCPQPPLHTVPLCLLHNDKCRERNRKGNPRSGYGIHLVWLVFVLIGLYFTAPRHLLELHLRLLGRCLLIVWSAKKNFLGLQTVLGPKGFTCYWTSLPSLASPPFGNGLTFQRVYFEAAYKNALNSGVITNEGWSIIVIIYQHSVC